jgi:hypothetical protein
MIRRTMNLTAGAAAILVLSLAAAIVGFVTHFFHAFSFPWIAWCLLGFGAIITFGREMIVIRDPADGPGAGPIGSRVNAALARVLLSTPYSFIAATVVVTLLYASVDTFGLLPTSASLFALYVTVRRALRLEEARLE